MAPSEYFWMITSRLGGGISFWHIFKMAAIASNHRHQINYLMSMVKPKQKLAYVSKYCFDFDNIDIKLYIFWDAEAIC